MSLVHVRQDVHITCSARPSYSKGSATSALIDPWVVSCWGLITGVGFAPLPSLSERQYRVCGCGTGRVVEKRFKER